MGNRQAISVMNREPEGDLIPEQLAIRRGMTYRLNAKGFVCEAFQPQPFLIDRLLERRIIGHDSHFYGVQFITMRKLFLKDVSVKVGMLRVKHEDGASEDKPIPMEDTDYLKVLREMRNNYWKQIVMAVCVEDADPELCNRYGRMGHAVELAFEQLSGAVQTLWERKRQIRDAAIEPDDRFR